jgi:O-succinylbenzoic acid--CoA ligase
MHAAGLQMPQLGAGEVGFATSGSTGDPKIVIHTRASLEASARMVIAHLGIGAGERWLRALPVFHVGGFGVELRAWISGQQTAALPGRWDAACFHRMLMDEAVCWASLVPAQVADLVALGERPPAGLRGIVVGGGRLQNALAARAHALGWPLLPSYGMTETASQVATGLPGESPGEMLPCMDGWQLRVDPGSGVLEIKGCALADCYLESCAGAGMGNGAQGAWRRAPLPGSGGWFHTADRVELRDGATRLRWLGRADAVVKILGELVSLDALQAELEARLAAAGLVLEVVVLDVPDGRDRMLVVVAEDRPETSGALEHVVACWNDERPGIERLARVSVLERLPRSEIGKVDLPRLRAQLARN